MSSDILNQVWPEWKIVKELGRGSYGIVYEAERSDALISTRSAIKIINIPASDLELDQLRSEGMTETETRTYLREIVNDFIDEIRVMGFFRGNNNIVSIEDYKVIEREDRISWTILIRMELLTPFKTYISNRTLSEEEVISLGLDICSALELCEKQKIIHRDIKPENLFVNNYGSFKLGDFGVARNLGNMTGSLSMKGTMNYMAPEVEKGKNYDHRADIYSLGLVLYRLMNNNLLPFLEKKEQMFNAKERTEALVRRLSGEPLPAPCNASGAFANVILTACDPDPDRRFNSATAMKEALENLKEDDKTKRVRPPIEPVHDKGKKDAVSPDRSKGNSGKKSSDNSGTHKKRTGPILAGLLLILAAVIIIVVAISLKHNQDGEKENADLSLPAETAENISNTSIPANDNTADKKEESAFSIIESDENTETTSTASSENILSTDTTTETETESESVNPGNTYIPVDTVSFHGNTYELYDISMTWQDAEAWCEENGGHLATITSNDEQILIDGMVSKWYFTASSNDNGSGPKKQYWIGLFFNKGAWTWVTDEPYGYTNWDAKQPNRYTTDEKTESYGQIRAESNPRSSKSTAGCWNDAFNDNTLPGEEDYFSLEHVGFICEYDAAEREPADPPITLYVTRTGKNIRKDSTSYSDLLRTITDPDTKMSYYGVAQEGLSGDDLYVWYQVAFEDGLTGWIRSDYVTEVHQEYEVCHVTENDTVLKSEPSFDSDTVMTLDTSSRFFFYYRTKNGPYEDGTVHEWYRVYFQDGSRGWIPAEKIIIQD